MFSDEASNQISAADVVAALVAADLTIAAAESLTGGLVAAALTSVAGSSACFRGGIVSYATDLKVDLLGVDPDLLLRVGPVDADVARSLGVADGDVSKLREEVKGNREREVKRRIQAQIKEQVMNALLAVTPIEVPKALVQAESQQLALGGQPAEHLSRKPGVHPRLGGEFGGGERRGLEAELATVLAGATPTARARWEQRGDAGDQGRRDVLMAWLLLVENRIADARHTLESLTPDALADAATSQSGLRVAPEPAGPPDSVGGF